MLAGERALAAHFSLIRPFTERIAAGGKARFSRHFAFGRLAVPLIGAPLPTGRLCEKCMFEPRPADQNADVDACRSADRRLEVAAGQELPSDVAADVRLSVLGLCCRFLLGNLCATVKSAKICMAGVRVYNAAAFALALTAIEDVFALHRARQSCRSTVALLAVERDHAVHMAGEAARRIGLMARIAREVGEEAAYPLRVRLVLVLENLRRTVFY